MDVDVLAEKRKRFIALIFFYDKSQYFALWSAFSYTMHGNPLIVQLLAAHSARRRHAVAVLMKVRTEAQIHLVMPCVLRLKSNVKRAIVVLELVQFSTRHNVASGTQQKQVALVWARLWDVHECLGFMHLELGSRRRMVEQGFCFVCLAHVHVVVGGKQEVRVSGRLWQVDGLLLFCQVGKGRVVARLAIGVIDNELHDETVASEFNHAVDMGNDLGEGGRVQ